MKTAALILGGCFCLMAVLMAVGYGGEVAIDNIHESNTRDGLIVPQS